MHSITVIAKNTFKECIRDRIVYAMLGFAVLFILSSIFFGSISLGEDLKIIRDFGLAGIYLFSLGITIFIGASLIYKEIERRTLYLTLSRPVSRADFVIGKFFGLLISVIVIILLMSLTYLPVVALKGGGFDWRGLVAIAMSVPEIAIFIALSILFSTFTTPLASTIYSAIVLFIGHSLDMLLKHFQKNESAGLYIFKALYYLLPNLEKFNLRNIVVHSDALSVTGIVWSIIYGVVYTILLLWLSVWSLRKQEL